MNTITDQDIARQVTETLGTTATDFDIPGIVAEIIAAHGLIDIDDMSGDDYWPLVQRHDTSA